MGTLKFAYLTKGNAIDSHEFQDMHFKQLTPAEAGCCIDDIKYQVVNAFCDYGRNIERDPNISIANLDEDHKKAFEKLCYIGAFCLELEEEFNKQSSIFSCVVYFLLIPSNTNSICALYDVKCA